MSDAQQLHLTVGFAGRTNTGKSTLLNSLVRSHRAIVSHRSHTTTHASTTHFEHGDYSITFIDTPGMFASGTKKSRVLRARADQALNFVDVILFCYTAGHWAATDNNLLERLADGISLVLVPTKIDLIAPERLAEELHSFRDDNRFAAFVPTSARRSHNLTQLLDEICNVGRADPTATHEDAPDLDAMGDVKPTGKSADPSQLAVELVREQIYRMLRVEVPYTTKFAVAECQELDTGLRIDIEIVVARSSQVAMIVGKKGQGIAAIGKNARAHLKKQLEREDINLFLKVVAVPS